MDYSQVCQGWIYCITNKVNGKRYIGQTNDFERRKREHFCLSVTWCPVLHNAILKYGIENFEMEPLITFTAVNREVCVDVMNQLEIFYIKKYKSLSHQNGYNVNEGGKGNTGFRHSEETKKAISKKLTGRKMPKEFGEAIRARHPEVTLPDRRKAILLYNLNGSFYKEYCSIKEAMLAIGKTKPSAKNGIIACLRDPTKQIYSYLWRYKVSESYPLYIEPYKDTRGKPVYYYNLEGQLISSYPSAGDAARQTGIFLSTIESSLKSERQGRKRKGNYWSHIPPNVQPDC